MSHRKDLLDRIGPGGQIALAVLAVTFGVPMALSTPGRQAVFPAMLVLAGVSLLVSGLLCLRDRRKGPPAKT